MYSVLLTQYEGSGLFANIFEMIVKALGIILNAIFIVIDKVGFPNIALAGGMPMTRLYEGTPEDIRK